MNYIAHLHIANITDTSFVGNFLGDFVKGQDLSEVATHLHQGIRLHRKVDVYTDTHQQLAELRKQFPPQARRMAGVVLDVYFDHLLLVNWHQHSELDFDDLFTQFYTHLNDYESFISPVFQQVRGGLLNKKWLADYKHQSTCLRAFKVIESRLNNKIEFADAAYSHICQNTPKIEAVFNQFYPQLLGHAVKIAPTL